jgi:hypothetical protein
MIPGTHNSSGGHRDTRERLPELDIVSPRL